MLKRERGWDLETEKLDIWSIVRQPTGTLFRNNVTGGYQQEPPAQFSGGILADLMGLGKTLSMISLVLSDQERASTEVSNVNIERPRRTTLLIVPSSLFNNWITEFRRHIVPGAISWVQHYGARRIANDTDICQYDLVLTTLKTVSSEYGKHKASPSILFSATWDRLIIDEAHCIRNRTTLASKAVFAIEAGSRWAVTGTPIQNHLDDFVNLLQFLRMYPYSNRRSFETDIIEVWKAGRDEEGLDRLKKLVQNVTLRRSRSTIELPERADVVLRLKLTPEESSRYAEMESAVASVLDDAIHADHQQTVTYTNVLAKIDHLRRFCNLGLSCPNLQSTVPNGIPSEDSIWDPISAQSSFEAIVSLGQTLCSVCGLENSQEDEFSLTCTPPCCKLTQCLRLVCGTCCQHAPFLSYCEHRPACKVASISTSVPPSRTITPKVQTDDPVLSTKISALVSELNIHNAAKR